MVIALDLPKLKSSADKKKAETFFQRVGNIGKEENIGYQHFLLFP